MKYCLGIDAGSVSAAFTLIDREGKIIQSDYRFHKGQIEKTLKDMLETVPFNDVTAIGSTSSTPKTLLSDFQYDSQVAIITSARHIHGKIGALLYVGGEKFGLLRFDEEGDYSNLNHNTSCAAGTGSFLDQQAGRLNLAGIEEFCRITASNKDPVPKIASRCAVFAKTDLIHAQQEGYSLSSICEGLCKGLAKNLVDTLFMGRQVNQPLIFCGGVSLNPVVKRYIEELSDNPITVDSLSHLYGAYGAALSLREEALSGLGRIYSEKALFRNSANRTLSRHEPLELKLSDYPDFSSRKSYIDENHVEVDLYEILPARCPSYLGVDIGSTSTKAVLMNRDHKVLAGFYTQTSGRPLQAVKGIFEAIDRLLDEEKSELKILSCGTTGSGRKFIGKIIGSDLILDEITAHARAAYEVDSEVDTIIEIGGQDSKFTTLNKGIVTSSTMNNVCAAGTGSFLEEQAGKMNCEVTEYEARTMNRKAPVSSDRCTVFMERDMNHFLNEGFAVDDVLASAIHSVRENYLRKVASESRIGERIYFQGATARNKALVAAFEQRLNKPVLVSKFCHLTGAMGVGLLLIDQGCESENFKGIELYKEEISVNREICGLCANHCKLSVADVNSEKVAYGFLCGRDYKTKRFVNKKISRFHMLAERKKIFTVTNRKPVRYPFTIGIPAALHLTEELPLWKQFFNLIGVKIITSEDLKEPVEKGKIISEAEFCAPVTAIQGHVQYLLDKADYIFLPFYLEKKRENKKEKRKYCYYTQFSPTVIKAQWESDRILSPLLYHNATLLHTKTELYRMFQKIEGCDLNWLNISNAYDEALGAYENQQKKLKKLFQTDKKKRIQVVLLGRPYTVLSPEMNKGIPEIFSSLGINVYFQDMIPIDKSKSIEIQPLLEEIHWNYAAKIMEATETIISMKNVYPVLLTSFKCSPDSYIKTYLIKRLEARDKPYLILELDEHGSSVGYETRIEAAVRAFGNHSRQLERKEDAGKILAPEYVYKVKGKTLLIPNWDNISCRFIIAILQKEGYDARLLDETDETIKQSLKHNSGQCIPMNAIAEGLIQYVEKNHLVPDETVLWMGRSSFACNIPMYSYHIRTILNDYGRGMEKITIYKGHVSFADISPLISLNVYFAFMFGGYIRRMGCRIRPYEVIKGETDRVEKESVEIMTEAFLGERKREEAAQNIIGMFESIEYAREEKPKVAIFGDFYARDNDVMNQDLIHFIEENGGEVITTPYNEYAKIIADSHFKRLFREKKFGEYFVLKPLLEIMKLLERSIADQFSRLLSDPVFKYEDPEQMLLDHFGLRLELSGESSENILKICHLVKHYPDISLFVQTNPAFCCAGIVTEAMRSTIEEVTGVPVISITYDGTGGNKNEAVIPFLKFPKKRKVPSSVFVRKE